MLTYIIRFINQKEHFNFHHNKGARLMVIKLRGKPNPPFKQARGSMLHSVQSKRRYYPV